MSDPRYGVPSASCASRVDNCPPSFELAKHFDDPGSRDSKSGDLVHKALEHWVSIRAPPVKGGRLRHPLSLIPQKVQGHVPRTLR